MVRPEALTARLHNGSTAAMTQTLHWRIETLNSELRMVTRLLKKAAMIRADVN